MCVCVCVCVCVYVCVYVCVCVCVCICAIGIHCDLLGSIVIDLLDTKPSIFRSVWLTAQGLLQNPIEAQFNRHHLTGYGA